MSTQERLKVLVVDDEERIVRTISRLLKPHYEVYQAQSGQMALEVVRSETIHVIVSDQRMPEMTGSELLNKVKIISPNTTRILLTGYSDLTAVIDSVNQGEIFRYITKPWNNDELLNTVEQASKIALSLFSLESAGPLPASDEIKSADIDSDSQENALILDQSGDLGNTVTRLLGDRINCIQADTLDKASDIFIKQDIDLLLLNISLNDRKALAFIKTAKLKKPNILCLVVADGADITHITSLINEGQIYRFIVKPAKTGQLKMYMCSALRYCKQLNAQPELMARHTVAEISDAEEIVIAKGLNMGWKSIRHAFQKLVN